MRKSARGQALPQVSDATIQRMLSIQEQKLSLEIKQTEIALRELDHNQKIADTSIAAQERDRKHEREELTKRQTGHQWFVFATVVVFVVFSSGALYLGKENIVMDILKLLAGFAGGMGYQAYRTKKKEEEEE